MKNLCHIYALTVLFYVASYSNTLAINVQGIVLLELQADHTGIEVRFERIAPSYLQISAYTDISGHYAAVLEPGIYSITMSKVDYLSFTLPDMPLYSDQIIDTVVLETLGLSGQLSGSIGPGIYKIGGNITVAPAETLTLQPGTEFRFMQDITFQVFGALLAEGTKTDSIIFTRFNEGDAWKGIDFKENSSPGSSLKYCIVEYSNDRGISVFKCSPAISHCLVRYNSKNSNSIGQDEESGGGAGICLKYSNSLVDHTVVRNNTGVSAGIGIYASDGHPQISNSMIINNTSPAYPYESGYGGGIFGGYSVNMIIENCVIAENSSDVGGGICVGGTYQSIYIAEVRIFNSIIYGNLCGNLYTEGAGIESYGDVVVEVSNSIVFGNVENNFDDEYQWLGVNVTVNQNLDSCDAYGNIVMDPMFMDVSVGDFRLMPGSPAIDAGNNLFVTALTDLSDNHRIWDGNNDNDSIVDIGCYEYESVPVKTSNLSLNRSEIMMISPNPTKGMLRLVSENVKAAVIRDLSGKLVLSFTGNMVDVSSLKQGFYMLTAQLSDGRYKTGKFILSK